MTSASDSNTDAPSGAPVPPEPSADGRRYVVGMTAFLGGPANVVMQLCMAPVGHGVAESMVDSGKYTLHPFKRLRTTLTYLAVAMMGTPEDRRIYRQAVNGAHRAVHSGPDSPVRYNAFDPELQLWVAACLYVGFRDSIDLLYGPRDDEFADQLYRDSIWLGTTLQVRPEMWPADRAAFAEYWTAKLPELSVDDTVRRYLVDEVIDQAPLPAALRAVFTPLSRFFTIGYLPDEFRAELGLTWTERDRRRFTSAMRSFGRLTGWLPQPLRLFPFNLYLWDMRRRIRRGAPLV